MQLSFEKCLHTLLPQLIADPSLHARWLNTLSYMENCGARKIAACEHPTQVKEEMLKHAAEEFRHAHHLKRQIEKVSPKSLPDYSLHSILGGMKTMHYLEALDLHTSRYLSQNVGLSKREVQATAYLLVTFAIEKRAEQLYTLYDAYLRRAGSKANVKALLLEEKEHLAEMQRNLDVLPSGQLHAHHVCLFEEQLYQEWIRQVAEIFLT